MAKEEHTHDEAVNTRAGDEDAAARRRLQRIYGGYTRSWRKQRAWAAENPGNVAIREELRDLAWRRAAPQLNRGGRILDLGCGGGWWLRELVRAGVAPERLYGVDLLEDRLNTARVAAPGADIRRADIRELPFEDDSFAVAFAFTVLSSLPDAASRRAGLAEAKRILAPRGLLLLYEPRFANPLNRRTRLLRDRDLAAAGIRPTDDTTLTLLPWLARRLGRRTGSCYARLARLGPLCTHRLIVYRREAA